MTELLFSYNLLGWMLPHKILLLRLLTNLAIFIPMFFLGVALIKYGTYLENKKGD